MPIAEKTATLVPGINGLCGPLADASFAVSTAGGTGAISFYNFSDNFALEPVASGIYTTATPPVGTLAAASGLGKGFVPSALGIGAAGALLVATREGYLGPLVSGASGMTKVLASGGFSSFLAASGLTWASTEVQGGLAWVSGL